jgi:hypothetical protein
MELAISHRQLCGMGGHDVTVDRDLFPWPLRWVTGPAAPFTVSNEIGESPTNVLSFTNCNKSNKGELRSHRPEV